MSLKTKKIFICGHNGMVGNSLLKYLKEKKFENILIRNRKDLDLTNFEKLNKFIKSKNQTYDYSNAHACRGVHHLYLQTLVPKVL